jgi:hypothetical protein
VSDADCDSATYCIPQPGGGSNFCAPACGPDSGTCDVFGVGFSCEPTTTVDGATVNVCPLT